MSYIFAWLPATGGRGRAATGRSPGHLRLVLAALFSLALLLVVVPAASAQNVLHETFENGAPAWAMSGMWHVQTNPERISVLAPDINPTLVTLPDSGQLPAAFEGASVAWFGEAATGTFCGADFASFNDPTASKTGCTSGQAMSGQLTSPSFSLAGATSAELRFSAWYEIEGVAATGMDLMDVEYSVDGGATWAAAARLNPISNPAGTPDQGYSNNGLGASPSWAPYVVDLSAAAGSPDVRIRVSFNTGDTLYQGFRGLAVDAIDVNTVFTEPAPVIQSVDPSCAQADQPGAITGSGFVSGSRVLVDGADAGGAVMSATRIELIVPAGAHTLQVVAPNGATSNVVSLCAATAPASTGPVTTPPPTAPTSTSPPTAPTSTSPPGSTGSTATPPPPPPVVGDPPPPPPLIVVGQQRSSSGPSAPVLGRTANAAPVSGTVRVRVNGVWRTLKAGESIPLGSTVDARKGVVAITSAADAAGTTQTANFGSGMFVLRQTRGTQPVTELVLTGGDFAACPPPARAARARGARVARVLRRVAGSSVRRRLWGDGHGRFRTRGRYGAATVRGTRWITEDRCDGTRVRVERGVVAVRDLPRRRTVSVVAGKSYLAKVPAGRAARGARR